MHDVVAFIRDHKDRPDGGLRWGVDPICVVLTEHGVPVAPSTYYDALNRPPSKRQLRDEHRKTVIALEWDKRTIVGARTRCLQLRREGHDIGCSTVERLMRELGLVGVTRGNWKQKPADAGTKERRAADLVDWHFHAFRPDDLWVADFTYVWTWAGWVYVAFVFDVCSRRILGWRAATSMATPLVLDCLERALWARGREGVASFRGLTHHTDAGSVCTSIAFTESQIGLYKTELTHQQGPWRHVDHVEAATADWAHWFNTERTPASIWDLTPIEAEQFSYAPRQAPELVG